MPVLRRNCNDRSGSFASDMISGVCPLRPETAHALPMAAISAPIFSGIASASVHGWLWLVAAFLGSVLGTYLRPWFGLSVEGNLARAQAGPTARD